MNKELIVSISIVFLFMALAIVPEGYSITSTFRKINKKPPINPEDDGDHYPCGYEFWCYHACLLLEDGQHWDATASFVYFMNKTKDGYDPGLSFLRVRHWNRQTEECYDYLRVDDYPGTFQTEKNKVNLTYGNSYAQGLYPDYYFHCEDLTHNIILDLYLQSISYPTWVLEEVTNGNVPWIFSGTGRAYFIPVINAMGTIDINGTIYNFTGLAYFEHDFADINFGNPFVIYSLKEAITGIRLMITGAKWLLSQNLQNRWKILTELHISNDYLLGWTWSWVAFDNGWSIVIFRPTILGIAEGYVPIFLYFTKDGINYSEIGYVYWKNKNENYIERVDIFIPIDFEITAHIDDIEFNILFNCTTEITELYTKDLVPYSSTDLSCSFYWCGTVEGYYKDKASNIPLSGTYGMEQSRILTKAKHRSRDIEIILPPDGLGFRIKTTSHLIGFERYFEIMVRPRLKIDFYIRPAP